MGARWASGCFACLQANVHGEFTTSNCTLTLIHCTYDVNPGPDPDPDPSDLAPGCKTEIESAHSHLL